MGAQLPVARSSILSQSGAADAKLNRQEVRNALPALAEVLFDAQDLSIPLWIEEEA